VILLLFRIQSMITVEIYPFELFYLDHSET
jgi:hypothetical protein